VSARPLIGVDLGGTKVEAAVIEPDGTVLWRAREATPPGDYDGTIAAVAGLVRRARAQAPKAHGVGLGHPGSSSSVTGLHRNANSTCLNGRPLLADLERVLGMPVRGANDANCLALSEAIDGAGKGARTVFGVILGTGCGGGVVVDRRVLEGANGIAGEWGHMPLPGATAAELGMSCWCGRRACLEMFLSGPGVEADHAVDRPTGARPRRRLQHPGSRRDRPWWRGKPCSGSAGAVAERDRAALLQRPFHHACASGPSW
jgi:fructokinase